MINKKCVAGISCISIAIILGIAGFILTENKKESVNVITPKEVAKDNSAQKRNILPNEKSKNVEKVKNNSIITEFAKYDLPFISITEIAKLPDNVQTSIKKILENNSNVYLVKYSPKTDATYAVMEKQESGNKYSRHSLGFVKINNDGEIDAYENGYTGEEGEISNAVTQTDDVWEFDNTTEPIKPLKHTAFDDNGKVKYTEEWNYSEENPVKYEMKNAAGNTISIFKESQNGDSEYNIEHIFYDDNGKTTMSLSVGYKEANVKHVSFYDSKYSGISMVTQSEFSDGNKIGEKVYSKNFDNIKSYTAKYTDGEISDITEVFSKDEDASDD